MGNLNNDFDTFFYTRMGIGISDRRWWEFRLRLFAAVTLPSVARHCRDGAKWILFIDSAMDADLINRLKKLVIGEGIEKRVQIAPIDFVNDIPENLQKICNGNNYVRIVRIDDDDAISADFFDRVPTGVGLYTLPLGYEIALTERKMIGVNRPFLSLNTIYSGPTSLVESYAWVGHHRLPEWAVTHSMPVVEIDSKSRSFLYVRHKQSDTSYGGRRKLIVESPSVVYLTAGAKDRFGVDDAALEEWRAFARTAPAAPASKTWDRTAKLNAEADACKKKLKQIKDQIRAETADIFG